MYFVSCICVISDQIECRHWHALQFLWQIMGLPFDAPFIVDKKTIFIECTASPFVSDLLCICVFVYLCFFVYVFVLMYLCLCICIGEFVFVCLYLCICICRWPPSYPHTATGLTLTSFHPFNALVSSARSSLAPQHHRNFVRFHSFQRDSAPQCHNTRFLSFHLSCFFSFSSVDLAPFKISSISFPLLNQFVRF